VTGPRHNRSTPPQARNVPPQQIHEHRLSHIIRIVPRGDAVSACERRAAVQRLPPEDAAEGAVVAQTRRVDDLVHGPAIQLLVGGNDEGEAAGVAVGAHRVQRVVAVASDALVDGQQLQPQAVVMAAIQEGQHVS
jgi:hypothetical protein